MLGDITAADEIYIVTGRTDMRKSIDGLCAIVEDQLHMDPRRSALYLFCGKRCDRIKALLWESDGFVLLYKRMEVQGRFRWPRNQLEVKQLTWQQFDWLMSGLEIEQPLMTYLEDGHCSLSNNLSENAIRPFTVGRKNWLFSEWPKGAASSAIVYTMVEMVKANDLNTYKYLTYLLSQRPDDKMSDEQLEQLAPWSETAKTNCQN